MANGHFLVLTIEYRTFDNYPTSDTDPFAPTATIRVAGDVVVEYTRDGTVANRWSMFDLLDPFRIGYGVFVDFWGEDTVDWTLGIHKVSATVRRPGERAGVEASWRLKDLPFRPGRGRIL